MNCPKCRSLKISTINQGSKEVSRCGNCGFVVVVKVDCPDHSKSQVKPKQKPKQKQVKKVKPRCLGTNPPNVIDHWLWSHGIQAMSGADATEAEE